MDGVEFKASTHGGGLRRALARERAGATKAGQNMKSLMKVPAQQRAWDIQNASVQRTFYYSAQFGNYNHYTIYARAARACIPVVSKYELQQFLTSKMGDAPLGFGRTSILPYHVPTTITIRT